LVLGIVGAAGSTEVLGISLQSCRLGRVPPGPAGCC